MTDLQYPVGKFATPAQVTQADRERYIANIEATAAKLLGALDGLKSEHLEIPYRRGGWSIRQIVHHIPESHMNSYIRFKLALTEDKPTIRPYDENGWAVTNEVAATPINVSVELTDALHKRWAMLLRSMNQSDFERELVHPALGTLVVHNMLALYDWHARHHVAQIEAIRAHFGW